MLSKHMLLIFLWEVTIGKPEAIEQRSSKVKIKQFWNAEEWIYIKDIEVSLKMLKKEMIKYDIDINQSIADIFLENDIAGPFKNNDIIFNLIENCKRSLNLLSNP